jgi:hypothetical protein
MTIACKLFTYKDLTFKGIVKSRQAEYVQGALRAFRYQCYSSHWPKRRFFNERRISTKSTITTALTTAQHNA